MYENRLLLTAAATGIVGEIMGKDGRNAILRIEGINKRFGGLHALRDVSFDVSRGEKLGLIGPNGSGKTTLFSVISGFVQPNAGSVYLDSERISGSKPHAITKRGLGRTFQVVRPFVDATVLDNVVVGALKVESNVRQAKELAETTLERCGLHDRRFQIARSLQLVDRKRLEIARILAGDPKVFLLDETMAGLRPREAESALELIQSINDDGVTLIIVEHMMRILMSIVDRVVVLNHGQVIGNDSPKVISRDPKIIEAYLGRNYAETQ